MPVNKFHCMPFEDFQADFHGSLNLTYGRKDTLFEEIQNSLDKVFNN